MSAPLDPVIPVPIIDGHTELSSCSGDFTFSARSSTGGGGRDMVYRWYICDDPPDYYNDIFSEFENLISPSVNKPVIQPFSTNDNAYDKGISVTALYSLFCTMYNCYILQFKIIIIGF